MNKIAAFLLCSFFFFTAKAQPVDSVAAPMNPGFETIKTYEDTLALLSFLIVNDSLDENRLLAVRKFIPTLVTALKTENSFDYPFKKLQSISIQYPADSTFRIFTWQLYVDENDYRYFGAIQMNTPQLKLFPLKDRSYEVVDVNKDILPAEKWYGAVYYNLKGFDTDEGKKYLLFGYDGFSFQTKRKLIDVLSFKEEKPVFGAPVFVSTDPQYPHEPKNRIVLTFSAAASVKLNYDGHLEKIVFDHLIRGSSEIPGQPPSNLPDGSYEGYELKNGRWEYVNKIFNHVYETAPREEPILDGTRKKDIMGKEN